MQPRIKFQRPVCSNQYTEVDERLKPKILVVYTGGDIYWQVFAMFNIPSL
jgi:hypothetical protein